jgi:hypothetical protein
MEDDAPHLSAKQVVVAPVETREGAAVEGDLVGERATVLAAASGERYALVEASSGCPRGGSSSTTISTFDEFPRRFDGSESTASCAYSPNRSAGSR